LDSSSFSSTAASYHRVRTTADDDAEDAAPAALLGDLLIIGAEVAELFDDMVSHLVRYCVVIFSQMRIHKKIRVRVCL
jgi:hypothetical protein